MPALTEYDHLDGPASLSWFGEAKSLRPSCWTLPSSESRPEPAPQRSGCALLRSRAPAAPGTSIPDGPFRGVPFLLKDMLAVDGGTCTTNGCSFFQGIRRRGTARLVRRLKAAGLIIVGKTNTSELGILPVTEPRLFGPTRNPWDTRFITGGSSGGSATAVGGTHGAHGARWRRRRVESASRPPCWRACVRAQAARAGATRWVRNVGEGWHASWWSTP